MPGSVILHINRCGTIVKHPISQDLGSTPATLEASRAAETLGAQVSWAVEAADVEQAYAQAEMKGAPTRERPLLFRRSGEAFVRAANKFLAAVQCQRAHCSLGLV